jgi:N-acetylneuraminate synthase/N,N'-diacetyllegionaminate synthase
MSVLILVPARGGSKGLPGKNLREVAGISLVGRAVRTARAALAVLGTGRVIVDSDSEEIAAESRRWGAETPYLRPSSLAGDEVGTLEVVRHALARLGVDARDALAVVVMQPTSPLTPAAHVVEAVRAFRSGGGRPAVSVAIASPHPSWSFTRDADGTLRNWNAEPAPVRRQDLREAWTPSGAVYVASAADLLSGRGFLESGRTIGVILPAQFAVDIDDGADLIAADGLAARAPAPFSIGEKRIGPGHPCFIIAEAGVNHDGDVAEAHRLVDVAADIGADAVKFQTWQTEFLVRPGAPTAAYQRAHQDAADQFAMLKRLELPYAVHGELKRHAEERGIVFLSTPDEIASARFLVSLGVAALKVGSGELDNLPYLAQLGCLGLPLLLSTGMGNLEEVAAALDCLAANGDPPVALFHTVSAYPAPIETLNLRAIETLRRAFGVPVGFSDHYPGPEAALAAVGLGLPLWEKHVTRGRSRPGPDHRASLEPEEFARQIVMVRAAERALGEGRKVPQQVELTTREAVRKRLVAARAIAAGQRLAPEDLLALRSDCGLAVSRFGEVISRIARVALRQGEPITEDKLGD